MLNFTPTINSVSGGPSFKVGYDQSKSKFVFEASVPENMWLGLAYGLNMSNVDMVMFRGTGEGSVTDLWAVGNGTP